MSQRLTFKTHIIIAEDETFVFLFLFLFLFGVGGFVLFLFFRRNFHVNRLQADDSFEMQSRIFLQKYFKK